MGGDIHPRHGRGTRVCRGHPRQVPGQAAGLQLQPLLQLEGSAGRRRDCHFPEGLPLTCLMASFHIATHAMKQVAGVLVACKESSFEGVATPDSGRLAALIICEGAVCMSCPPTRHRFPQTLVTNRALLLEHKVFQQQLWHWE